MAEIGNFFVTIGSKFDSAGFQKARAAINKVAVAGAAMAAALTFAGLKVAKAAGVQEDAQALLAQAMKTARTFTNEAFEENLRFASSLQKVTTFGDETILVVQRMLTNFGLEGEALKKATKATIDLAAAKGFDLKVAGDLVAKSIGSSTNALTRYGIEVTGAVGSTERVETAVNNITKLFGGAATAQAKTYTGQVAQLRNRWGDFIEQVGQIAIPIILKLVNVIRDKILPVLETWIANEDNLNKTLTIASRIIGFVSSAVIGLVQGFNIVGSAIATSTTFISGLIFKLRELQARLTFNKQKAQEFGATAEQFFNAGKIGAEKLTEAIIQAGESIREANAIELESFILKEQGKTTVLEEEALIRQELEEEQAKLEAERREIDLQDKENKAEVEEEFRKKFVAQRREREEAAAARRIELANDVASTIVRGLELVSKVEVLTFRTGAQAFAQALKDRMRQFILQKTQELIAAKVVALAKAIFNSTITFGAASAQIGIVLGQFAVALGALRGLQSFDVGGTVQGPTGKPVLVQALGGEKFLGRESIGRELGNTIVVHINRPLTSTQEARRQGHIIGREILKDVRRSRKI